MSLGRAAGSQPPPSILFASYIKVFEAARFQRQHKQPRRASGKAGGTATGTADPCSRLGKGSALLSQPGKPRGARRAPLLATTSLLRPFSPPAVTASRTRLCLNSTAEQLNPGKTRRKAPAPCPCPQPGARCSLGRTPGSRPPASGTNPPPRERALPAAQPHASFPPRPSQLQPCFALSPPLCGGSWWLSRVTYTELPFRQDFFLR